MVGATDKVFEQALVVLKMQGATLVDITTLKDRDKMGEAETLVLDTELKANLNAYLATTPPAVKTRTTCRPDYLRLRTPIANWRFLARKHL